MSVPSDGAKNADLPPNKKRKLANREKMKHAIAYYRGHRNDKYPPSKASIAEKFGLNKTTFRTELNKLAAELGEEITAAECSRLMNIHKYRLLEEEEQVVLEHILHRAKNKVPLNQKTVAEAGNLLLLARGSEPELRKAWIRSWKKRTPELQNVNYRGLVGLSIEFRQQISSWFKNAKMFIEALDGDKCQVWNMVESIYRIGAASKSWAKVPLDDVGNGSINSGEAEYVSVLETVSGDGKVLTPFLLYKGHDTSLSRYKPENVPPFYYRSLENGLLTPGTAIEWLEHLFIRETGAAKNGRTIGLILEESSCFTTSRFQSICREHNIYILYIPKVMSRIFQPLDQVLLSVIPNVFRGQLFSNAKVTPNDVDRGEFIISYDTIRQERLKPQVIQHVWKIVGLFPFDSSQVFGGITKESRRSANNSIVETTLEEPTVHSVEVPSSSAAIDGTHLLSAEPTSGDLLDEETTRPVVEELSTNRVPESAMVSNVAAPQENRSTQESASQTPSVIFEKRSVQPSLRENFTIYDKPLTIGPTAQYTNSPASRAPPTAVIFYSSTPSETIVESNQADDAVTQNTKIQNIETRDKEANDEENRQDSEKRLVERQILAHSEDVRGERSTEDSVELITEASKGANSSASDGFVPVLDVHPNEATEHGLDASHSELLTSEKGVWGGKIDAVATVALTEEPTKHKRDCDLFAEARQSTPDRDSIQEDGQHTKGDDAEVFYSHTESAPRVSLAELLAKSSPTLHEDGPKTDSEVFNPQDVQSWQSKSQPRAPPMNVAEISLNEPWTVESAANEIETSSRKVTSKVPFSEAVEKTIEPPNEELAAEEADESVNKVVRKENTLQEAQPQTRADDEPNESQTDKIQSLENTIKTLSKDVEFWRQQALQNEKLFQSVSKLFFEASKVGGYTMRSDEYDYEMQTLSPEFIERALGGFEAK
ncbi:hypothetical protein KGF57_003718 [Candida theae]|uniref:DDE-1 domain-containing protein n=1 Tax=Candida theae TaxID=1198502 RepID=A0AAD5BCR9_9ASCO|nr:uncharacterized protein KGF57_003718 [Candida theae]KAI5955585.1 hypothetical protein KGF57_003718 [Candida theae]